MTHSGLQHFLSRFIFFFTYNTCIFEQQQRLVFFKRKTAAVAAFPVQEHLQLLLGMDWVKSKSNWILTLEFSWT